jgi:hypothetical protein
MKARVEKLEGLIARLQGHMKPFESNVTSMPYNNFRLAKVVAGPEAFPTEGHTFYINFVDGEYVRTLGNTAPLFQSRSPRLPICYNLNETIPPENSIIKVFEQNRQWWTWWGVGSEGPPAPSIQTALFHGCWIDGGSYLRDTDTGTVASEAATGGLVPEKKRYVVTYDDYQAWLDYEYPTAQPPITEYGEGTIGATIRIPADRFHPGVTDQTTPLTDFRIQFQGSNITAFEPRFVSIPFGGGYYEYDPVLPPGAESAMNFDVYAFAGPLFDIQDDGTGPGGMNSNNQLSGPNVFGPVSWTASDDWESTYDNITNEPNVMGPQLAGIINQLMNGDYWTDPANAPVGNLDSRSLAICFVPSGPAQSGAADLGYFWNQPGVSPNQLFSDGEYNSSPVGKTFGNIRLQSTYAESSVRYYMDPPVVSF